MNVHQCGPQNKVEEGDKKNGKAWQVLFNVFARER